MMRWFKVIRSALLIIGETTHPNPVRLFPAVSYATNTAIRLTLNNKHITSALFPTRTAPDLDLPPGDPVVEEVGPTCDAFCDALGDVVVGPPPLGLSDVLAALLVPWKKLDGSPVGGSCGDPVVALLVGLPALGTIVPDSVTVGTSRGNPYAAHSSAKSVPNRLDTLQEGLTPCTTENGTRVKHG
jgi:hypothetical protein